MIIRPLFSKKKFFSRIVYSKLLLVFVIALPSIYVIDIFWKNNGVDVLSGASKRFNKVTEFFSNRFVSQKSYISLRKENLELKAKLLYLEAKVNLFSAVKSENKALKELLGSSSKLDGSFVETNIIHWVGLNEREAFIDKGSKDMVFLGQAVLDGSGIYGQVTEVGVENSKIKLVTDESIAVPVKINSNLKLFAHGNKQDILIGNLPSTAKVSAGQVIYASGVAGIYPEGYPFAKIVSSSIKNDGKQVLHLQPLANLQKTNRLLLYWKGES